MKKVLNPLLLLMLAMPAYGQEQPATTTTEAAPADAAPADTGAVMDSIATDAAAESAPAEPEETAMIPVIHLSAVGDFDSQLEDMEDGLTDYFTKPFEPRELAQRVEDFLDPVKREAAARLAHQKTGKLRLFAEIMHRERND